MDIKTIILKSIYGQLAAEEQAFLDQWLAVDNHQQLYERIRTNIINMQAVEHLAAIDVERALRNVKSGDNKKQGTDKFDDSQDSDSNSKAAHTSWFPILNSYLYRVAAVLVLLIVGGTFWYREHTRVTPPTISEEIQLAMEQSRITGRQAAEVINGDEQTKVITRQELTRYHVDEHFAEQLAEARRITTYQDKEYWVTLEDGTLVHLNYDSRLIYPEKFGDRRDVILDGEAYFMVAKDKSRQFVVHTPQGDVKVYGTEFNVNTREKENLQEGTKLGTSVVLVSGSVSFTPAGGKELMMKPGQQITCDNDNLSVSDVDVEPFVAWSAGKFSFNDVELERVVNVLSKWYNVSIDYASDDIRHQKVIGYFDRYEPLENTLRAITLSVELRFRYQNGKIIIEK